MSFKKALRKKGRKPAHWIPREDMYGRGHGAIIKTKGSGKKVKGYWEGAGQSPSKIETKRTKAQKIKKPNRVYLEPYETETLFKQRYQTPIKKRGKEEMFFPNISGEAKDRWHSDVHMGTDSSSGYNKKGKKLYKTFMKKYRPKK
jgi:hypothetical protein